MFIQHSFRTQFPDDILHLIFEIVLDIYSDHEAYDYYHYAASSMWLVHHFTHPRRTIPLVCKHWRELSVPYLWRTCVLRYSRVVKYGEYLAQRPHLALHVRHLIISMNSRPDITKNAMSIIRLCRNVRVLNFMIYSGANLITILSPISSLQNLRRLVLRMPSPPSNSFIEDLTTIAHDRELDALHLGIVIFTPSYKQEVLLPLLEELAVPEIRITCSNFKPYQPGWNKDDYQPLSELCEVNENISRLELCGIALESEFLQTLQAKATPPQDIESARRQYRRIFDVLYISDIRSEMTLMQQMFQATRRFRFDVSYRPTTELDEHFKYEWMQVEV